MADDVVELVPAARMTACIEGVLGALGVPPADAAIVAEALVEADLTGVDSHGIHLLSMYVERLRGGHVGDYRTGGLELFGDGSHIVRVQRLDDCAFGL